MIAVAHRRAAGRDTAAGPALRFELPDERSATVPSEARGLERDGVRLLVAEPERTRHVRFRELPAFLRPGDLLVVNTSKTLPAAVDGWLASRGSAADEAFPGPYGFFTNRKQTIGPGSGMGEGREPVRRAVTVHFSTALDGGEYAVELRPPGRATGPVRDAVAGERVSLPEDTSLTLRDPYPDASAATTRLWRAVPSGTEDLAGVLARHGRPIAYGYVEGRWPLEAYQTVFARHPGSAEMPSAGRPFTHRLLTSLVSSGVQIAPVVLHTGVSSLEGGEPPLPERFRVPLSTARRVNGTRASGGRVIAVGTTVTRALETVAGASGPVMAGEGWTDLVLGRERPARVVDGLITGWHAPGASHLSLLEAVAGPELVEGAYAEAVATGYLWHEFGDACLLLRESHQRSPRKRSTARRDGRGRETGVDSTRARLADATDHPDRKSAARRQGRR